MAKIRITRNREGKIDGASEKDRKAYLRFRTRIMSLEVGELMTIDAKFPRNPELHGWHFIILDAVFEAQEQFEAEAVFRKWVEVGAGHCDFVPGPRGRMVAIPKSIGWDELDDVDFQEHHEKAVDFLRSADCTRVLWGHLSEPEQANMIEAILAECEIERQRIRQQRGKRVER
jgi:hypothetical protein